MAMVFCVHLPTFPARMIYMSLLPRSVSLIYGPVTGWEVRSDLPKTMNAFCAAQGRTC